MAVVFVFAVMLATFGSFRLPLVILAAIPLALIGVALALGLTRTPVNVSSFMGLLLLVGIVVKNGILLIDVANKRRAAGDDVVTSLVVAGSTRLRPILMTTLAAIGGLLPLALGIGSGAEMEKPLAIAVIGGLSTATLFTLVLIPVLYAAFTGADERRRPAAVPALATMLALMLAGAAVQPARAQAPAPPSTPAVAAIGFAGLTLADAQRRAVSASPEVRTAQANVAGAQAAYAQARGQYGLAATSSYAEAPQGGSQGTIAQRLTTVGAQVTLGDVVTYAPLVAQAAAALRAAQTDATTAERTERVRLVGIYFAALKARSITGARGDALASAQAFTDAARKRFAAGDAPHIDVVRADLALARAQGDLARARADDANATDALQRETNVASGALGAPATAPVRSAMLLAPDAAIARATLVRSDLHSAEENVRAAQAGVTAAQRAVIPPVTVSAGYTRGVDSGVAIGGPTIGASIAIPLGGALGAKVRTQRALLDAAVAKRDAAQRLVATEVGAAARNAAAAVEAQRAGDAALAAAKAELDAASLGYRSGATTSLDLASSRSAYAQAQVDDLSALYDRLQAQATLDLEVSQ